MDHRIYVSEAALAAMAPHQEGEAYWGQAGLPLVRRSAGDEEGREEGRRAGGPTGTIPELVCAGMQYT